MAIAFDTSLGSSLITSSGTTIPLTTSAAAAAGSRIFVCVTNFGTQTVTGVSGGGLTWVEDYDTIANNIGNCVYSADAPAGLASGTTITATYTGTAFSRGIGAVSFTGVATGASGYLSGTPAIVYQFGGGGSWVTGSVTPDVADALLLSMTVADSSPGATGTVTAPATERLDDWNASSTIEMIIGSRVVSSIAAYTIAGTYAADPGDNRALLVGYKAAAGAPVVPSSAIEATGVPFWGG